MSENLKAAMEKGSANSGVALEKVVVRPAKQSEGENTNVEKEEVIPGTPEGKVEVEEKGPKKKRDGFLSWAVLLAAVCLFTSVSAQEFTVFHYYNAFMNFAENHREFNYTEVASQMTDWALPPYYSSIQALIIALPVLWLIETKGVRLVFGILAVLTTLGVGIKAIAAALHLHIIVVFIGQSLINLSRIGLFPAVHRLCVAWFSRRSISVVCAIAFFGDNLGILVGYLTPHLIFWTYDRNKEKFNEFSLHMIILYGIMASLAIIFSIITAFIQSAPKEPSSLAEKLRNEMEKPDQSFIAFLKRLKAMYVADFKLVMNSIGFGLTYGLTMMIFHPIRLTVIFEVHEGIKELDLPITSVIIACGYIGSLVSGCILDWTRKHHYVARFSILGLFAFHVMLVISIHAESMYFTFFCYGGVSLFFAFYMTAAIEYSAERSYPALESTSTGILVLTGYVVAGLFSVLFGTHFTSKKDATLTGFISTALLSIGALFTIGLEPSFLKRHNAGQDVAAY